MRNTPIHQTPVELLVAIFQILIDENTGTQSRPIPFMLCEVCRQWQAVLLSTPLLWARLQLTDDFPPYMPVKFIAKYICLMLNRSRSYPLVITYGCAMEYILDEQIREILLQHIHRWQVFENLDGCLEDGAPPLHAPRLRYLTASTPTFQFPFDSCPSLTHLTWHGTSLAGNLVIPWNQLVDLKMARVITSDVIKFLMLCPQLITAEFVIHHPNRFYNDNPPEPQYLTPPITHYNLHTLVILDWGWCEDTEIFFGSFVFPALSTLSYDGHVEFTSIQDTLRRSRCTLQAVELRFPLLSRHDNPLDILQTKCFSSLTCLILYPWFSLSKPHTLTEEFVKVATIYPSSMSTETPYLCPKLEELIISQSVCPVDGLFGQMIRSRFELGCLKLFKYNCHCYGPSFHGHMDMVIFEELQEQGHNIVIQHHQRKTVGQQLSTL
ncbi:hypothetical protein AMATHDRAFT_9824 [Amanita thiersii Skay4041]|uniref:Uncharacterized protein n=1 Tax=Amanita thiersii Skay4041 TaxID=703135 RepID=A0A2A9N642_9AGAR|nr:hypothetical protein AMATHDRAFT_9824 [Amanita thiersii Skay4041]